MSLLRGAIEYAITFLNIFHYGTAVLGLLFPELSGFAGILTGIG